MGTASRIGGCILAAATLVIAVWQARSFLGARAAEVTPRPSAPPSAPTPRPHRILAEGRLEPRPGAKVVVSSELAGRITNVVVREKSRVTQGSLLAEIQADDVYASLMESRARVAELKAEIELARSELRRGRALAERNAVTPQDLERLTQQLETFEARRTTAEVTVKRLEITLAKTRVTAPISGVVLARHAQAGEVVMPGSPLVTLVDLGRTWIEAEVDEYDAGRLKEGLIARIRAEGYDAEWQGRIEELPDRVTPRSLLPQDPAQPSDVRVLCVKIAPETPTPLRLGQRVEVEIRFD
jgi:RND family efflux transporter MFP subunit